MPKFEIRVCYEVWEYYHFTVEATNKEAAERKCAAMLKDSNFEWPKQPLGRHRRVV
jgi:hypothetical protein